MEHSTQLNGVVQMVGGVGFFVNVDNVYDHDDDEAYDDLMRQRLLRHIAQWRDTLELAYMGHRGSYHIGGDWWQGVYGSQYRGAQK